VFPLLKSLDLDKIRFIFQDEPVQMKKRKMDDVERRLLLLVD
jgi:hypothetical protein